MSLQEPIHTASVDVVAVLKDIVADTLTVDPQSIAVDDSTNLFDLGLDSTNVVEILLTLERQLGIQVDENDLSMEMFERFGRLEAFVRDRIAA